MSEQRRIAQDEASVSQLYQNSKVAQTYMENRFTYSWQRLLHERQVYFVDKVIKEGGKLLEIAPGPARIAADLTGVERGMMLENSLEMIDVASHRLEQRGLLKRWRIIHGSAFDLGRHPDLSETFDVIYSFRFIRHLVKRDRKRIYDAVREKLSPDGYLIFDVVNKPVRDRLEARNENAPSDALLVYDKTYTPASFNREMRENGFSVIELHPVLKWFELQYLISIKFYDIIPRLHRELIDCIEKLPVQRSLEWVAICRKAS